MTSEKLTESVDIVRLQRYLNIVVAPLAEQLDLLRPWRRHAGQHTSTTPHKSEKGIDNQAAALLNARNRLTTGRWPDAPCKAFQTLHNRVIIVSWRTDADIVAFSASVLPTLHGVCLTIGTSPSVSTGYSKHHQQSVCCATRDSHYRQAT